jgi:hypothetical protein
MEVFFSILDEELWAYMDLNFKAHDPYSLIILSKLGVVNNPALS